MLLDRVLLEYRAQFYTLRKKKEGSTSDTPENEGHYDSPRKLEQPHFFEEEEVQLRHRSIINN
jgi:hypothetical protein